MLKIQPSIVMEESNSDEEVDQEIKNIRDTPAAENANEKDVTKVGFASNKGKATAFFQTFAPLTTFAKKEELRELRKTTPPPSSRRSATLTSTGDDAATSPDKNSPVSGKSSPVAGKELSPRPTSAASSADCTSLVRATSAELIRKAAGSRRKTIANTLCIAQKPDLSKVEDPYALYRMLTMGKAATM